MTFFLSTRRRLLNHRQPAVSKVRNERTGETTENEVLVLDRVDGSCRRSISVIASETSTFFARITGHRKVRMSRHETRSAETATAKAGSINAHFALDEDIMQMKTLLRININLHHYASLKDGCCLGDSEVAGLISIQHRVVTETEKHLAELFDEIRSAKT